MHQVQMPKHVPDETKLMHIAVGESPSSLRLSSCLWIHDVVNRHRIRFSIGNLLQTPQRRITEETSPSISTRAHKVLNVDVVTEFCAYTVVCAPSRSILLTAVRVTFELLIDFECTTYDALMK